VTNGDQMDPGAQAPAGESSTTQPTEIRPPADPSAEGQPAAGQPAEGQPGAPPPGGAEEPPPSGLRKWWWVIALAVAALVLLIAVLIWALGGQEEEVAMVAVPDVVGMTLEEAETALTDVGLTVGETTEEESVDVAPGSVISQDPDVGSEAEEGSSVDLVISVEPVVEMVVVPDIVGMDIGEAKNTLQQVGLVVGDLVEEETEDATPGEVLSQDPTAGIEVEPGGAVSVVVAVAPPVTAVPVPNVVGMTEPDAVAAIEAAGLVPRVYLIQSETVARGVVIEQQPAAGTELEPEGTVGIAVSTGPPQPPVEETATVPDLTGQTVDQATSALEAAGLVPQIFDVYHESVPEGSVVSQFPTSGTEVLVGSAVAVVASKGAAPPTGPETVEAPDVTGMTLDDAEAAITGAGLDVIPLTIPYDQVDLGTVFFQLPSAGSLMQAGSYMVVFVAGAPADGGPPMVQPYVAP
jgi:beta-lactam-binding protein with PASTA domain